MGSPQIPIGQLTPFDNWSHSNRIAFAIQQLLSKLQTATLVQVVSCTNEGGLSPVGTVNVVPMVNQVDSAGNPYPHTTIYNVPYVRMFGGKNGNAIILDPVPGDIGVAVFASRDLTQVIATQAQANPGSARQYDYSDGLYIGGILNGGTPTQYIQFDSDGISIVSPSQITLKAPTINLQGNVSQTDGTISAETDVTAGPNSISLTDHLHTSGEPGSPTSAPLP